MTNTTVALSRLLPAKDNPRHAYDQKSIEGLAQSLAKDGLIHNLTVRPEKGGKFRVIAGMRRYLALQHLRTQGTIARTYKVPVRIEAKFATTAANRLATVENVQREALDPIDEAEAFAKLLQGGTAIDEVSAETGISAATIRRRLALANLTPEVKQAVRDKKVSLALAETLTLATPAQQKIWLKHVRRNPGLDAGYLRSTLLSEKPSAAIAIFPLEHYKGGMTRDLFADEETTYFDDREQFLKLQSEAVEAMAVKLRERYAWVEVVTEPSVAWWQYRPSKRKEPAGAVIHLAPTGRVEVRKALVRHPVEERTAAKAKKRQPKAKMDWSKPTLRYANAQKTVALQAALIADLRRARETVACLLLATGRTDSRIKLELHPALAELARDPGTSKAYAAIETACAELIRALGLASGPGEDGAAAWHRLLYSGATWQELTGGLRALSDAQLETLIMLALLLCFGSAGLENLTEGDTLFGQLAEQLAIDLRQVWTPDAGFLKGLRREQLVAAATASGALHWRPKFGRGSKRELVAGLATYFSQTADPAAKLSDTESKGRTWLPACMRFAAADQSQPKP